MYPKKYSIKITLIIVLSVVLAICLSKLCISLHDEYAFLTPNLMGIRNIGLSTELTRKINFKKFCDGE